MRFRSMRLRRFQFEKSRTLEVARGIAGHADSRGKRYFCGQEPDIAANHTPRAFPQVNNVPAHKIAQQ
jgi:hypothetical protein